MRHDVTTALVRSHRAGRRRSETWIADRDKAEFGVAATGEGPEYFAEYKTRALREIVDRTGLDVKRICDFGSGIGNSIPYFRRYFPEAALTSSDVSERSLLLGRQRHPEAGNCVLIENNRIPVEADSFDVVSSACVFHHIPHGEHLSCLQELHRIARPGGLIAISSIIR